MKTKIQALTFLLLSFVLTNNYAQTTVNNGNWSDLTTWGGVPPLGTGDVVINHTVTLDVDYSHTSGSITINASGALNGNSSMRMIALNYPSGSAYLAVHGTFNVARISFLSDTVTNSGTIQADSLLNFAAINNNSSATIDANQFWNSNAGNLTNNGAIISANFLNTESVINNASMTSNDFANSKDFTNSNTGIINISNNFSNIDSLTGSAIFTNDGIVAVSNDWHNGSQVNGSGQFCIVNNTSNSGSMTGTFDFCDFTGGHIDLNTGTIASTITFCVNPCVVGTDMLSEDIRIKTFPNPFSSKISIYTDKKLQNATLVIYNCYGQIVAQKKHVNGQIVTFYRNNLAAGLYFLHLTQDNKAIATKKIIMAD